MSSHHVEVARQGYDAMNRADWDALVDLLHPEIQWRMSTRFARAERTFHGHDGVREAFAFFQETFTGFRAEPHEFIEEPPWVVVRVTLHGCVRGSGDPVEYPLVQALRFSGGRIIRHEAYASAEEALEALRNGTSSTSSDAGTGREK
jgi:ketosteroid isomerase-like protein